MSVRLSPPEIGRRFSLEPAPVELEDVVRYAGAAGDFNPIHFDRDLALSQGFRSNFAQGMLTAGLLGVLVGTVFGPTRIRGYGVRFSAPLWVGDEPVASGEIVSVEDGLARVELSVTVEEREVMRGWATVDTANEDEEDE